MVKAATGGQNSSEQLPIVFTVPKFLPYKLQSVCADYLVFSNFTLLGYGDVGVPALLVMLALKFDLHLWPGRWTKVYYPVSGIGMEGRTDRSGEEEGGMGRGKKGGGGGRERREREGD